MKGNYQDQLLWQPQGLKRTLLLTIVVKNKTTCLSLTPGQVDQQPQQLLPMKTKMISFTLEPTLLRKKSNLDGVHPHLATPMGGVNPLPKLEIGNNPHLM
jgi:hypothetical protein